MNGKPLDPTAALPAWRMAALPGFALLGIALPLLFLGLTDQYLYYVRPVGLLPIYATTWLLLAIAALPLWGVLALAVKGLDALEGAPRMRTGLRVGLLGLAAAIAIAALLYAALNWASTFGWHWGDPGGDGSLVIALALGVLLAAIPRTRAQALRLSSLAMAITAVGAASVLSLPVFGWHGGRGAAAQPGPLSAQSASGARPNIVLLTIDALSAEHMSLYGAPRPTTPELARFAQGATTFERAYANANFTTPGVASILTSTRPWTHRALQLPVWPLEVTRRDSLPALLARSGYQTGYVSTNANAGAATKGFGAYFGFARTDRTHDLTLCTDGLSSILRYACAASEFPVLANLVARADRLRGGPGAGHYDPRLATQPALAWLRRTDKREPVFLWVHLFPPHSPYATPQPWLGRFDPSPDARDIASTEPYWAYLMSTVPPARAHTLEARYEESVAYVDHYAARFLDEALAVLGPNTIVVVTADHGESFGHGYGAHTGPGLDQEIIHVPLIVKLPGQTEGRRSEVLAEQIDVAPTLAQAAGLASPPTWEGRSLLGACAAAGAAPSEPEKPAFSMNFEQNPRHAPLTRGSIAVIEGRWKLVHYMGALHYPQMPPLHDELYDLASDPAEHVNRAAAEPDEVKHLRTLIDAELARHGGAVK